MALNKGMIESGLEEDVVLWVGECAVGLEFHRVVRVEEMMNGRRGCQCNGESVSRT